MTIYRRMQIARQLGDRGSRIVDSARERLGSDFVKPEPLAHALRILLAPHEGEPLTEAELQCAMDGDEGDGAGWLGAVQYDQRFAQPVIDRTIARECARFIVEEQGDDPTDRELVEYVATALCGAPRPIVKATAALVAPGVDRVRVKRKKGLG